MLRIMLNHLISKLPVIVGGVCLICAAFVFAESSPQSATEGNTMMQGGGVSIIEIDGTIDQGLSLFVERALRSVPSGRRVLLHVNTFGGRVDAAVKIRDAILSSPAETIAFVDRRAISAGALISLAATHIYLRDGATIGAATPVESTDGEAMRGASEKVVSYMRAEMRATAEARGRNADIAQAMVDRDVVIKHISSKGKLLTLTAKDALKLKFIDGTVADQHALFESLGMNEGQVVPVEINWAERVVRWITNPVVSSLLTTIGTVGLLTTFYSGTIGVLTALGVSAFCLFFFGHYIANLAGLEELLLFAGGLIALLLEVFVIPGFGIAGMLGLLLLFVALALSLVELNIPANISWELGYGKALLNRVAIQMFSVMVLVGFSAIAVFRYLPKSRFGGWLILKTEASKIDGYVGQRVEDSELVGAHGIAVSDLRPSGIAQINSERVDVVTRGDFVSQGTALTVVDVSGGRVVVESK